MSTRLQQTAHKGMIVAGIATRRHVLCGPLIGIFNLTFACNLSCRFCGFHPPDPKNARWTRPADGSLHLDPGLAVGMLEDLQALGTRAIVLQGEGEPLLYPPLFEVLGAAKKLGLECQLVSNGTKITEDAAEKFVSLGLDELKVSIMTATRESYEALRGRQDEGSWEAVCDGVKTMARVRARRRSATPKIRLHHALSTFNVSEVAPIVDHASELGADMVTYSPVSVSAHGVERMSLDDAQIRDAMAALKAVKSRAGKAGVRHNVHEALARYAAGPDVHRGTRCYIGWLVSRVRPTGEVIACTSSLRVMGRLQEQRFRDIWRSPAYRDFRLRSSRKGGMLDPELNARCSYCFYHPLHKKIDRLLAPLRPFSG
jgi:MoaA/NifB/PqqE/SkfB family radical SAM enzyme